MMRQRVDSSSYRAWADYFSNGGCHFYIAAVGPNGNPLNLSTAYYLPTLLPHLMIVGPKLLARMQSICDLSLGYTIPLAREFVSAHAWHYDVSGEESGFVESLYRTLGVRTPPSDDEILRRLSMQYPAPFDLPQMHLILAPSLLRHSWVWRFRRRDKIVLSLGKNAPGRVGSRPTGLAAHRSRMGIEKDALLRTRLGDIAAAPEILEKNPVIGYEGFLIPRSLSEEFGTSSPRTCHESSVDAIHDILLEW